MRKYFLLLILSIAQFSYSTSVLDQVPGYHSSGKAPAYVKTLVDSSGRTFVFWLIGEYDNETDNFLNYTIKWAYRSKGGTFSTSSIIGTMSASEDRRGRYEEEFPFDVNIDSLGNIAVLFGNADNGNQLVSAYRKAGDNQNFSIDSFTLSTPVAAINLKAAPNNTFFAILSLGEDDPNFAGYYYMQTQGDANSFSEPKLISARDLGFSRKTSMDFDFDPDSNVCFAWLNTGGATLTTKSDVFYAFKPVNGDFQSQKKVNRISNKNYTTNIQVIYNGTIKDHGRTWGVFWEETTSVNSARTKKEQSPAKYKNYIRAIMLENNTGNTNVTPANDAKNLYEGQDDLLAELSVSKLQSGLVLIFAQKGKYTSYGITDGFVDPLCNLYYNRYNLNGLLGSSQKKISLTKINQLFSSILRGYFSYSVAINPLTKDALIGNDEAWGTIPFKTGKFVYLGLLSSTIQGFDGADGVSVNYILPNVPIVSWFLNLSSEPQIVASSVGAKGANFTLPWKSRMFFQRGLKAQSFSF